MEFLRKPMGFIPTGLGVLGLLALVLYFVKGVRGDLAAWAMGVGGAGAHEDVPPAPGQDPRRSGRRLPTDRPRAGLQPRLLDVLIANPTQTVQVAVGVLGILGVTVVLALSKEDLCTPGWLGALAKPGWLIGLGEHGASCGGVPQTSDCLGLGAACGNRAGVNRGPLAVRLPELGVRAMRPLAAVLGPLHIDEVHAAYDDLKTHSRIGAVEVNVSLSSGVAEMDEARIDVEIHDHKGGSVNEQCCRYLLLSARLWARPGERGKVAHCTSLRLRDAFKGCGIGKRIYSLEGDEPDGLFRRWGAREIQMCATSDNRWLCFRWGFTPIERYADELRFLFRKWKGRDKAIAEGAKEEVISTYPEEFFRQQVVWFEAVRPLE